MGTYQDLIELSHHLKQERLFVGAEKEHLARLNEDVTKSSQQLYHLSWITRQQRVILDQLILGHRDASPATSLQHINQLESVQFVDSYRHLSYNDTKFGEFFKQLRENSKLVAACLSHGERISIDEMQIMAHIIMSSLYGNCVAQEDEQYVLQILKSLIDLQLACHENPRRLLRKGSCAFSVVFKLLNEGMFSAKLFLTAALHQPVMQLLMEDEWFYDIDPERALYRFPVAERTRRFGQMGTREYNQKLKEYRDLTTSKLAMLTGRFISSIKNNMFCFPQSLSWLVLQLYQTVTKAGCVDIAEARAMCTDLVFAFFICPAICDPEPYGITTDAPISYIARHNLMQVAQILQVLAISKLEEIDPKSKDLYGQFEKGCVSSLLDMILEGAITDSPPRQNSQLPGITRASALITLPHLHRLVDFLRCVQSSMGERSMNRHMVEELLASLPPLPALPSPSTATPNLTPSHSPPGTPSSAKRHVKGRDKKMPRNGGTDEENSSREEPPISPTPDEVMVITLNANMECPGMTSEQKVLSEGLDSRPRHVKYNNYIPGEDGSVSDVEMPLQEKRTRFSLSHDQDSIATSDIPEAVSEAASSHSVGSDLEENENDNLSDMMSANVSGRGTPSISGRDTPVSQAESQIEVSEERRAPDLPVTVQKTNREDVTERFGKFEIKAELEKDDIKSTVSDTWSTDVLASDSEPPEQNQMDRLEEVAEEMARQNLMGVQEVSEVSETASDAWSTDVLASDTSERQTDRLLELDQDDAASLRSQGQEEEDSLEASDRADDALQASGIENAAKESDNNEDNSNSDNDTFFPAPVQADTAKMGAGSNVESSMMPDIHKRKEDMDQEYGQYRHRAVSEIVGAFQKTNHKKHQYESCQRGHPGIDIVQTFDPFATFVPKKSLQSSSGQLQDAVVSPDQGIGSDDIIDMIESSETELGKKHSNLDLEAMGGIKLTEQQNVHLTANRLSTTISMFDPLGQDGPLPFRRPVRAMSDSCTPHISQLNEMSYNSRPNYHAQGARPKIINQNTTPHILIEKHEEASVFSLGGASLKDSGVSVDAPLANGDDAVTPTNANINCQGTLIDIEADIREHVAEAVKSNVLGKVLFEDSNKSRSSTESSSSSVLDCSQSALQVTKNSSDTGSQKSLDKEPLDEDKRSDSKKKSGFFSTFKEKLTISGRGSRRSKGKEKEESRLFSMPFEIDRGGGGDAREKPAQHIVSYDEFKGKIIGGVSSPPQTENATELESSDDILAKYRKRSTITTGMQNPVFDLNSGSVTSSESVSPQKDASNTSKDLLDGEVMPAYNPDDLENCKAFVDAKRKLRMVLSTTDIQTLPWSASHWGLSYRHDSEVKQENDLVAFLKVQLAEAMNLQDKDLVAQLHETLRCLCQFERTETKKLLKSMKEDYRTRAAFIAYLVRCRQGLLCTQAHLERLLNRVTRDKQICSKYFVSVCVRLFLEKREKDLHRFISEFQKLTMPDEKTDLVESFLNFLRKRMQHDQTWQAASDTQLQDAYSFIERSVMSHVYTHAMYPNGDGDVMRDQILHEHMQKLSSVITPTHKDLCIPAMYHYECPWPAAQAEIYMINAYKTPKDKLMCVLQCSSTIMNLLSMANEKSVPAADDFMPVLIYVLIKANPPSLLSTVQYVNSFYEKRLQGEEQYWWMQFSSAIEFIKTMDYIE